jgi:sphingosine kinase
VTVYSFHSHNASYLNSLESSHADPNTILYYNILQASFTSSILTITYVRSTSKDNYTPATLSFHLPDPTTPSVPAFISALTDRAYFNSSPNKRVKVIINPFGGRGTAGKGYVQHAAPILTAAGCTVDVVETTHQGHAEQLAATLDIDAWDVVACVSGDGIPHEVFNGLAKQPRPQKALRKIAVAQIPGGTGNGLAWNEWGSGSVSAAALGVVKGVRGPVDLVSVTQGDSRKLSFLSQAVGIIADSDLGTDDWRWMGEARFMVGYVLRLIKKTVWPCEVAISVVQDDKKMVKRMWKEYTEEKSGIQKGTGKHLSSSTTGSGCTEDEVSEEEETATSLPELRFGTVNDVTPDSWVPLNLSTLGNFYSGNMPMMASSSNVFPAACTADGLVDLMMVYGDISRLRAFEMASTAGEGGLIDGAEVKYWKVDGFRITPKDTNGYISVDGERIGGGAFQAEVHKGLGCILTKRGGLYEAEGPKGI